MEGLGKILSDKAGNGQSQSLADSLQEIAKYTLQSVGGNKTDDKPNILAQAIQPTNTDDASKIHQMFGKGTSVNTFA